MSEDKGKGVTETIADEAKGLAVEVYKDVGKTTLGQVGHVVGGLAKLVLWPVKLALDTANSQLDKLSARVEAKLKDVPPERLLPAPATVAGPAALHYALLGDGEDVDVLRGMFEDLLVSSMDSATADNVHPGFVSILSQLSTDEAWMLKAITKRDFDAPVIEVRHMRVSQDFIAEGLLCDWGHGLAIEPTREAQYLANMQRLGIIAIDLDAQLARDHDDPNVSIAHEGYDKLDTRMNNTIKRRDGWPMLVGQRGTIQLTAFGAQFWNTCVRARVGP